jgi:hypothetical protein
MIRYSNTPDKSSNVITDSPTSPVSTTRDVLGLNGSGNDEEETSHNLLDPLTNEEED